VSHARLDGTGMVLYENCSCKAGLLAERSAGQTANSRA
jgi:hypothetical protein